MDRETVIEKLTKYSELVFTVVMPNTIILFGSYAKGNWTENVKIDEFGGITWDNGFDFCPNYLRELSNNHIV